MGESSLIIEWWISCFHKSFGIGIDKFSIFELICSSFITPGITDTTEGCKRGNCKETAPILTLKS